MHILFAHFPSSLCYDLMLRCSSPGRNGVIRCNGMYNCSSNASKINRARELAAKKAAESKAGGGGAKGMAERKGVNALNLLCQVCKVRWQRQ